VKRSQIIALLAWTRQFPGSRSALLAFLPCPGIDTLLLSLKIANLERKKTTFENLLVKLQCVHPSVVVQRDHASVTLSQCQCLQYWTCSMLQEHGAMPDNFHTIMRRQTGANTQVRQIIWTINSSGTVHFGRSSIQARPWLRECSVLFLSYCVHLIPDQQQWATIFGLQGMIQETRSTGAITVLKSYWRAYSYSVLQALQQWFPTLCHDFHVGAAGQVFLAAHKNLPLTQQTILRSPMQ
jgi:hypothetical protein